MLPALAMMAVLSPAARPHVQAPIRLVIPFPPGGSTGYAGEVLAGALQRLLGRRVVLDAKPGNFGIDAIAELVGRSDASTLMVGSIVTNSMTPVWHRHHMAFDYDREVAPVTRLADFPSVVMISPSARAGTLAEFIAEVKSGGGRLTLGADFIGTFGDVDAIALAAAAGLEVAVRCTPHGARGILEDLVSGRSNFAFLNVATATANVGAFKPLAVTSAVRLANFPGVPTMAEAGFPGIGTTNWQGLFAPRRISAQVLAGLHRAAVEALHSAQARAALAKVNAAAGTSASPAAFAAAIRSEMDRWQTLLPRVMALAREQR
jgi:tripartite-type tricarboxylate transporter receptor subunit TctC